MLKNTSRREWGWLLVWCCLTLGFSALPFIWGLVKTPPGQEFTGVLFNGADTNTYLAKMGQGRRGEWVFRLAHTSEGGDSGAVTYLYYLLLGKLAGLLNLSNILVFHVARLLNGFLLLIVSYGFIRLLFQEQKRQRWAFVLVCTASGLGWLLILLGWVAVPPDFWVAEGYTFLSIFANPHFPLATLLAILTITAWLFGQEGRGGIYFVEATVFSFLVGFIHPFMLLTLGAVLGIFWLRIWWLERRWNWTNFLSLVAVGIVGAPGPLLTWWGTQSDPLLRQWMAQNQTLSLDWLELLGSYGLLVPFSIAGAWWVERRLPKLQAIESQQIANRWRLVTGWVGASLVLLILPLSISRRFEEGFHLPLCCLAAAGWFEVIAPRLTLNLRKPLRQLATVFMAISTLAITLSPIIFINQNKPDADEPVRSPYLSTGEIGAIDWLNQHSQTGDVVLTGPLLGNVLPGRTPVRVFYGHLMETLNPSKKIAILLQFFDESSKMPTRYGIIDSWGLKYLVYGWREQKLGAFDPASGGWPLVYTGEDIKIYRLDQGTRSAVHRTANESDFALVNRK